MNRTRAKIVVAGAVVLGLVGVGLVGLSLRGAGPWGGVAVAGQSRGSGEVGEGLVDGAVDDGRRVVAVDEEAAEEVPPPGDLLAQLRRVARAEQALFASRDDPGEELRLELEEALAPLLFHPETLNQVLDLLRSGELRLRLDHLPAEERERVEGRIGLEEYGAMRTLYWGLLTYHASYGRIHEAGVVLDGEQLLLDVLLALPDIDEPLRGKLLVMLTEAQIDDLPVLGVEHLETILRLRALFPDHESVFSTLLTAMGEGMTPEERTAFFSVFLPETDDPILTGVTLRNLLRGADPDFALWLAGERFDDEVATPAMRAAIAAAVVEAAPDPAAAVDFLAERSRDTARMPDLYLGLGWQGDEARFALDTKYDQLAIDGADATARRLLVMGMTTAPTDRLLEIARLDPDPAVRGQALITLSANRNRPPEASEIEALFAAYNGGEGNGIGAVQAMAAASNLAARARSAGRSEVKREAVEFLVRMVEDPGLAAASRREAWNRLQGLVDEVRLQQLAALLTR